MSLQEIKKVIHLDNIDTVNKYLDCGWVIINTYTVCLDRPGDLLLIYSLGATDKCIIPNE